MEKGLPVPVVITVYADKSFTYIKKTPPASVLLKKAAGVEKDRIDNLVKEVAKGIAQGKIDDVKEEMIEVFDSISESEIFTEYYLGSVSQRGFPRTRESLSWLKSNPPDLKQVKKLSQFFEIGGICP